MSEGLSHFFGGAVCCGTCRFYEAIEGRTYDENDGVCHRFPPQAIVRDTFDSEMVFFRMAEVDADQWCGEYQPPVEEPPK